MAKADIVKFQNQLSSNESGLLHEHSGGHSHDHNEHGHTHEHLEHAGEFNSDKRFLHEIDDIC